jgi:hypothetical protein
MRVLLLQRYRAQLHLVSQVMVVQGEWEEFSVSVPKVAFR